MARIFLALLILELFVLFLYSIRNLMPPLVKFFEAFLKIVTFDGVNRKKVKKEVEERKYIAALRSTAKLEHELELLPHSSQDIADACEFWKCRHKNLPKPPKGNGGGSIVANRIDGSIIQTGTLMDKDTMDRLKEDYTTVYADDKAIMVIGEGMTITPLPVPEFNPDYDLIEETRNY